MSQAAICETWSAGHALNSKHPCTRTSRTCHQRLRKVREACCAQRVQTEVGSMPCEMKEAAEPSCWMIRTASSSSRVRDHAHKPVNPSVGHSCGHRQGLEGAGSEEATGTLHVAQQGELAVAAPDVDHVNDRTTRTRGVTAPLSVPSPRHACAAPRCPVVL